MFRNRQEAGRKLAEALGFLRGREDVIILGIPRGGVVVAREVASAIGVPLDVVITRKIGAPGNPELAVGAVTQEGEFIPDADLVRRLRVPEEYLRAEVARQAQEITGRMKKYRGDRGYPGFEGKTVAIVDDGIATASTVRAAVDSVRRRRPASVIVAAPVAPRGAIEALEKVADLVVCLAIPELFYSIGSFYEDFEQVDDETVRNLLGRGRDTGNQ